MSIPTAPGGRRGRHVRRRIRLRRTVAAGGVLVLAGLGVAGGLLATGGPAHPRGDRTSDSGPTTTSGSGTGGAGGGAPHHQVTRTFAGPYGVESSAIIAENRKPGTSAWKLSGAPASGFVDGFADTTYAAIGQKVTFYVSTTQPSFGVVAYRMGYYQGLGARDVWSRSGLPGQAQPTCPLTAGVNMVSCDNWTASFTLTLTPAFTQGDYLFKLTAAGNQQSYVPLTVWNPTSTAAYLVMARSLTEEGWNTYGGYSFYQGQGPCTLGQTGSYPPCNRARVVSFDRPYTTGDGASDFLGNEYPLVRLMEEHGLDVAYCTDITVDEHPTIVARHKALISLGHDETWTYAERQAAVTGLGHGVNLAFLGAAPLVRHARLQPSPLGPDREEVDYRNSAEDPLNGTGHTDTVTGNTFATPPTSAPVTRLVGAEYAGFMDPGAPGAALVVSQATSWLFKGAGLQDGSSIPGVIKNDIDHVNPSAAPANLEVLAHSPVPLTETYTNQGTWNGYTYADTTYYTDPTSGGGVFESGTVNWVNALDPCVTAGSDCPQAALARITGNLLSLFGQGPAGALQPSVPNLSSVTPPGS